MKTNKDYTVSFMHYGNITVPKGTILTHETAMGKDENIHFVSDLRWIKTSYPDIANILHHDLYYHGIDVPKEFVDYTD